MTRPHDSGVQAQQCCRPHIPITALSRSWGCFLFGSQSWSSTDSKAFGSGPFRIKCSRNLGNNNNVYFMGLRPLQAVEFCDFGSPRQLLSVFFTSLLCPLSTVRNTLHYILLSVCRRWESEMNSDGGKAWSPCSCQSLCHTCIIVLCDTNGLLNLFQHFRLPCIKSHYRSQFGYSVHLTVVLASCANTSVKADSLDKFLISGRYMLQVYQPPLCLHPHSSGSPLSFRVSMVPRWAAEDVDLQYKHLQFSHFMKS